MYHARIFLIVINFYMKRILILFMACCLVFIACTPVSKEDYLSKFSEFIHDVSIEYSQYTAEDWSRQNKKFTKFSDEWYSLYEKELSFSEKLKILNLSFKWYFYQGLGEVESTLDSLDVDQFKEEVKYYIDNNMMQDLTDLCDSAVELGEELRNEGIESIDGIEIEK